MKWDKDYTGGWRIDLEDADAIRATASQIPPMAFTAPEQVDPRPFVKVEHQASVGSCQGHSLSTIVEHCYRIDSGGKDVQLSRAMAYRATQLIDRIEGDRGSTINGGVKLAKEKGVCTEDLWPYRNRYPRNPPRGVSWDEVYEDAEDYRIAKHSVMQSYADVFAWLASGAGGVHIGIRWSLPSAGVVDSYRNSGGGHAVALLGYTTRKDPDGRKYILLCNSWGTRWGNNGWCEVAPRAIEQMLRARYTVMVGLTDLVGIEPRPIPVDYTDLI